MRLTPSLGALRAFEAAARHESFTLAAAELGRTHGAISHQIRGLESRLGRALFHREGGAIRLSLEGKALIHRVRHGLTALDAVFDQAPSLARSVKISMLGSFASHWFAARLPALTARFPDSMFNIHVAERLVDLDAEGVDAAIRYGRGQWRGIETDLLFHDYVLAVCAPAVAESIKGPEDLLSRPLLGDESESWTAWFAEVGAPARSISTQINFSDSGAAVAAAKAGAGVALGRLSLVAGAMRVGELCAPVGRPVKAAYSYYFVRRPSVERDRRLDALRDWIAAEGARDIVAAKIPPS